MRSIHSISIVGSGNVAWHLGHTIQRAGLEVVDLIGRTERTVKEYAEALDARAVLSLADMNTSVDLVLVCVSDDQIAQVETAIPSFDGIIAHTSGAKRMNLNRSNTGVFYPLQTFSRNVQVDFTQVPILIEGRNAPITDQLHELAQKVSSSVFKVDSEQRERLHVAAVFANNFSNHMFAQAYNICREHDIPFDVLHALIEETAKKAVTGNPTKAQTGPAVRQDLKTVEKHLKLITDPDQRHLYKIITDSIIDQHETKL